MRHMKSPGTGDPYPVTGSFAPVKPKYWQTLRSFSPYLWPQGRGDLRSRVVVALVALLLSKIVTVYVPVLYRDATNLLAPKGASPRFSRFRSCCWSPMAWRGS